MATAATEKVAQANLARKWQKVEFINPRGGNSVVAWVRELQYYEPMKLLLRPPWIPGIALLWLFAGLVAASPEWQRAPVPEWVDRIEPPMPEESAPQDGGEGVRYLLTEWQISVEPRAAYSHLARQILNTEGLSSASQISINFNPQYETLTLHSVDVFRDGTWSSRLDSMDVNILRREPEMEHSIFDGTYTANFSPMGIRVGDILRYEFTIEGANPIMGEKFFLRLPITWSKPLDEFRARITTPANRPFRTRSDSPKGNPTTERGESTITADWRLRDVPGIPWITRVPPWRPLYSFVEVSEYQNWGEVVDWVLPLYQSREPLPEELASILETLPEGEDPEVRARAVFDWTRENIRYLGFLDGENSHRPRSPKFTLDRGYGDCKAMAVLVCAMLEASGIKSSPVLVSTFLRQGVRDSLPSPGAFDHVIVAVDGKERRLFLDPTDSSQRGPLEKRFLPDYGYGLVIEPNSTDLTPLLPTPESLPVLRVTEKFGLSSFTEDGTLTVTTEASGGQAERLRSYFSSSSRQQISSDYLAFHASSYPGMVLEQEVEFTDNPENNQVVLVERYRLHSPWRDEEGEKRTFYYIPEELRSWLPPSGLALSSRDHAIEIDHPVKYQLTAILNLPEEWTAPSEVIEFSNEVFSFREAASHRGTTFRIEHHYETHTNEILPEDFAKIRKDLSEIQDQLGYTFSPPTPANWALPFVLLFGSAGLFLALCLAILWWIWQRNSPPLLPTPASADLVGIRGWLLLPAIGTFLTPVGLIIVLGRDAFQLIARGFPLNQTVELLPRGHAELYVFFAGLEFTFLAFVLGFSLMVPAMLITKSRWFPKAVIFQFLTPVVFGIFAWGMHLLFPDLSEKPQPILILLAVLVAAIWIPYLQLSKRVQNTFLR